MKKLTGGFIINDNNEKEYVDILINDGKIQKIAHNIKDECEEIKVDDKLITPGFIDVHTHVRVPGGEYKEDINTINKAALNGGYTQICAMPNTNPIIDNEQLIKEMLKQYEKADIKIYQYGALSEKLFYEKPLDYDKLLNAGALCFSNDGKGVQKPKAIYDMMRKIKSLNSIYVSHSEIDDLVMDGVMHEGITNKKLGLKGILSSVESISVAQELSLASEIGCQYHICHMSTKESVDYLKLHKSYNSKVSGEVTPHHLTLNEENIKEDDPNYKMNPPLRSKEDQNRLIKALNEGTIEIIATDHAPHSAEDKGNSFKNSAFGIVGLETAFSVLYTDLVLTNKVKLKTIIDALTKNPANIFNIPGGKLAQGMDADITIIDLEQKNKINTDDFKSKSKNTPYNGKDVQSKIIKTLIKGEIKYEKS